MNLQLCNPYVRFARIYEKPLMLGTLQAIDHRIFYFHSGRGYIKINNTPYPLTAGTIIYLPAGAKYSFIFEQEVPVFSGANFDFSQNYTYLNTPIAPLFETKFCSEEILEKDIIQSLDLFSNCIYLQNIFQLEDRFIELANEYAIHNLYYDVRCSTLLKDILIQTARLATAKKEGISEKKATAIIQYIHDHYQSKLSNKDLAKHFNYHENYISSLILKYTGLSLHQYVLNYKMHIAVTLLQSTNLTVKEVAEQIGMPDVKHFSKCFKNIIGYPPSSYIIR